MTIRNEANIMCPHADAFHVNEEMSLFFSNAKLD